MACWSYLKVYRFDFVGLTSYKGFMKKRSSGTESFTTEAINSPLEGVEKYFFHFLEHAFAIYFVSL